MGSHGGSRAGGSGGGGSRSDINRNVNAEEQMRLKQNISSLKGKDIDKMTRKQLLKYTRDAMLAHIGEPFYPKSREEAERRFALLAPAQSTAQLKKSLKNSKTRFTEQLKKR